MKLWAFGLIVASVLVGCKNPDDDVEPPVLPKTVAFEGQVDAKYAGAWKSADGGSALDLAKDGTAALDATTNSSKGPSKSHLKGKWLAKDGNLVFSYLDASGNPTTLQYGAKLSGNTLVLQQPGGKLKTTYTRP